MNLVAKLGYGILCFCYQDFLDMDCNIVEVMILILKLLRTSKRVSLGELIDHGFYPFLTIVQSVLRYIITIQSLFRVIIGSCTIWKKMMYLELFGDFEQCWMVDYLSEYQPIVTKEYRSMMSSSYRLTVKPPES